MTKEKRIFAVSLRLHELLAVPDKSGLFHVKAKTLVGGLVSSSITWRGYSSTRPVDNHRVAWNHTLEFDVTFTSRGAREEQLVPYTLLMRVKRTIPYGRGGSRPECVGQLALDLSHYAGIEGPYAAKMLLDKSSTNAALSFTLDMRQRYGSKTFRRHRTALNILNAQAAAAERQHAKAEPDWSAAAAAAASATASATRPVAATSAAGVVAAAGTDAPAAPWAAGRAGFGGRDATREVAASASNGAAGGKGLAARAHEQGDAAAAYSDGDDGDDGRSRAYAPATERTLPMWTPTKAAPRQRLSSGGGDDGDDGALLPDARQHSAPSRHPTISSPRYDMEVFGGERAARPSHARQMSLGIGDLRGDSDTCAADSKRGSGDGDSSGFGNMLEDESIDMLDALQAAGFIMPGELEDEMQQAPRSDMRASNGEAGRRRALHRSSSEPSLAKAASATARVTSSTAPLAAAAAAVPLDRRARPSWRPRFSLHPHQRRSRLGSWLGSGKGAGAGGQIEVRSARTYRASASAAAAATGAAGGKRSSRGPMPPSTDRGEHDAATAAASPAKTRGAAQTNTVTAAAGVNSFAAKPPEPGERRAATRQRALSQSDASEILTIVLDNDIDAFVYDMYIQAKRDSEVPPVVRATRVDAEQAVQQVLAHVSLQNRGELRKRFSLPFAHDK